MYACKAEHAWWNLEIGFNMDYTFVKLWLCMEYILIDLQNRVTPYLIINIFWEEYPSPFSSQRRLYYLEIRCIFIWVCDIGCGATIKLYSGHAMALNTSSNFKLDYLLQAARLN